MPNYRSQITKEVDVDAQGSRVTHTLVGEQLNPGDPVTLRTDASVTVDGPKDASYKARDVLTPGELIQLEAINLKLRLHHLAESGFIEV